jgi:hypothetical protein
VPEGLVTPGGEGLSGNAFVSSEETSCDKDTSKEKSDNDAKKSNAPLTMGDQAAFMFKSAIKETLQMKKMEDREVYVFYQ